MCPETSFPFRPSYRSRRQRAAYLDAISCGQWAIDLSGHRQLPDVDTWSIRGFPKMAADAGVRHGMSVLAGPHLGRAIISDKVVRAQLCLIS
jgi:hypothetical protein